MTIQELQACQSDLGAGEFHGADHLRGHQTAPRGDQAHTAWAHDGLEQPDRLL